MFQVSGRRWNSGFFALAAWVRRPDTQLPCGSGPQGPNQRRATVTLTAEAPRDRTASTHRRFRKHILNLGPLRHPRTGDRLDVDRQFVARMQSNLHARVSGPVPVQLGGPRDEHNEDSTLTIGEVVAIEVVGSKVFAIFDADRRADALGRTLLGCSAALHVDLTTYTRVGPTLLHLLITNRPYVLSLDGCEELPPPVELSASPRSRWTDESTAAFVASLRRQHPANVASARAASSRAMTRTREEAHIVRLAAQAEELGLCGPSSRSGRDFPAMGR